MDNIETHSIKNLSEKQLHILSNSLDMYTRLGIMQFEKLIDHVFSFHINNNISSSYLKNRDLINYHCSEIRNLLVSEEKEYEKMGKKSIWSMGIGSSNTPINSQISYELQCDIDNHFKNMTYKTKLTLTDETDVIVKEENQREEKLIQILNNLK